MVLDEFVIVILFFSGLKCVNEFFIVRFVLGIIGILLGEFKDFGEDVFLFIWNIFLWKDFFFFGECWGEC